ncbi:MAG: hypothetical protein GC162_07935 [Planctomycetes bacterium]|nr:hypothetical protein [Planctomycetota bacterium]
MLRCLLVIALFMQSLVLPAAAAPSTQPDCGPMKACCMHACKCEAKPSEPAPDRTPAQRDGNNENTRHILAMPPVAATGLFALTASCDPLPILACPPATSPDRQSLLCVWRN